MMERLFASSAPAEEEQGEDEEEDGDDMKLTSLQSISDFMTCGGSQTDPGRGIVRHGESQAADHGDHYPD